MLKRRVTLLPVTLLAMGLGCKGPIPLDAQEASLTNGGAGLGLLPIAAGAALWTPSKLYRRSGFGPDDGSTEVETGRFDPLLEMADPGEEPKRGGLLAAPLGRGVYVHTGLAFFRQFPEGIPGAYRLFANLVSLKGGSAGGG